MSNGKRRAKSSEGNERPSTRPRNDVETETVDDKYSEGDVSFKTSDGFIFKVQSHYLSSASATFRDSFQYGPATSTAGIATSSSSTSNSGYPREPIELTDPKLEHAIVWRRFMDLIHGDFPAEGTSVEVDLLSELVFLCEKWQLSAGHRKALMTISLGYTDKDELRGALVLAARMECKWIVAALLVKVGDNEWYAEEEGLGRMRGQMCLDPANLPPQYVVQLPRAYHWALSRAFLKLRDKKSPRRPLDELFLEALKQWDKICEGDNDPFRECV